MEFAIFIATISIIAHGCQLICYFNHLRKPVEERTAYGSRMIAGHN